MAEYANISLIGVLQTPSHPLYLSEISTVIMVIIEPCTWLEDLVAFGNLHGDMLFPLLGCSSVFPLKR